MYIHLISFLSKQNIKKTRKKTLRRDIHSWMHPALDSCSLKPNDTSLLFFPINNSKINEETYIFCNLYIYLTDRFSSIKVCYAYKQYVTFLVFLTGTYVIDQIQFIQMKRNLPQLNFSFYITSQLDRQSDRQTETLYVQVFIFLPFFFALS